MGNTTCTAGSHAGQHGLGQLHLCTSPRSTKHRKANSAGIITAGAARPSLSHAQKPDAMQLQRPGGLHGLVQDAALQGLGRDPSAAAQQPAEKRVLPSPPPAEHGQQLCMVPDTPVSDSIRDSAPDVQQLPVPYSDRDKTPAPASLGSPLLRPGGIAAGDKERGGGPLQGRARIRPLSPDLPHADGGSDTGLSPAPVGAEDPQKESAPQLLLDLQLSGTQSMRSEPQGLHSDPKAAAKAMPDARRIAAEALAYSLAEALPEAPVAPDDPLSGCLKQSNDRETPLVQCAQLAADLSTSDSSRRALAVRSALGAIHKVRASSLAMPCILSHMGSRSVPMASTGCSDVWHLTAHCRSITSSLHRRLHERAHAVTCAGAADARARVQAFLVSPSDQAHSLQLWWRSKRAAAVSAWRSACRPPGGGAAAASITKHVPRFREAGEVSSEDRKPA